MDKFTSPFDLPQEESGHLADYKTPVNDFRHLLPASARHDPTPDQRRRDDGDFQNLTYIRLPEANAEFLKRDLGVDSLNKLHKHLWLAGRPMPPRPLTYQLAASRKIVVMEDANLHLVWEPGRMFLKPIPRYLFSPPFWREHITSSPSNDPALYKCAYGFLLSYTALIQRQSDYELAKTHHLIPSDVTWSTWLHILSQLLQHSPNNLDRVNQRYFYGELRLGRLNKISRVLSLFGKGQGVTGVLRGYKFEFATYNQQLEAFLAPVVTAIAYILLVLTAMQVGLATDHFKDNAAFQDASWGFTVFSIIAPLCLVLLGFVVLFAYGIFNLLMTISFNNRQMDLYRRLGQG